MSCGKSRSPSASRLAGSPHAFPDRRQWPGCMVVSARAQAGRAFTLQSGYHELGAA